MSLLVAMTILPLFTPLHALDGMWHTLQVDNRPVDAWVPTCVTTASPIILSLHAWATSKEMQRRVDRLTTYAGPECAVHVYPEGNITASMGPIPLGSGLSWNAGGCCPGADEKHIDDVTYLDHVLIAVANKFNVNEQLTFVVGLSNGGMMTNRFACSNTKVKAMVAVSGYLINGTGAEAFTCDRGIPMLHFHGDADAVVPYDGCHGLFAGGFVCRSMAAMPGFPNLPWPDVQSSVAAWRTRNGIAATAPGTQTFNNASATCTSWGGVSNNVTLCKVGREGHAWPGLCSSTGSMPGMKCSMDIDASAEVMRFFRTYVPIAKQVLI